MGWLKTEFPLQGNRLVCLFVNHEQSQMFDLLRSMLRSMTDEPDKIEELAIGAIRSFHPELEGCTVHYVGFNAAQFRWEVIVAHGSLPLVPWGDLIPARPLIP